MISIKLEEEVKNAILRGESAREISRNFGVHRETVRLLRAQPTIRSLQRKRDRLKDTDASLLNPIKCDECGSKIIEWPCLACHPVSRAYTSGPIKPEDEGTVIKDGVQIAGHVIIPETQKIISLVRIARNLVEMQKEGLLACDGVLLRHLVADAKAALIVTEKKARNDD